MKRKLMIFTLLAIMIGISACGKTVENNDRIEIREYQSDGKEVIVENNDLVLNFNPETAQFNIKQKDTGVIWYSNPPDAANDAMADSASKEVMQSQLTLTYSTGTGMLTTFNSFRHSVKRSIYDYEVLDNGIRVNYTFGNIEREKIIPSVLPESEMLKFFEVMERASIKQIEQLYRKYDINNLRVTDNKAELLEKYPLLEQENVYILREGTQEYLLVKLEGIFEEAGYTYEEWEIDKELYANERGTDKPAFNVSIIYELEDDKLVVKVPYEDIQYKVDYPIVELRVLPYFGSAGVDEEGFMIVPEGSGGLIRFNNGKNNQSYYTNNTYGYDLALSRDALIDENRALFPVFGISKGSSSFICIIEEGDAFSGIEADVSGRTTGYNYVSAKYTVLNTETLDISSKSSQAVQVFEKQLPNEVLVQKYSFVDSPKYSDMAIEYREYLLKKFPDIKKDDVTSVPVAVEILGAIDRVMQRFGIPTKVSVPLTTYKEAQDIVKVMKEAGFDKLSVKYNGWFNGSVIHRPPDKVKLISELGSKKDFTNMVKYMDDNNVDLYLESDFLSIHWNSTFSGFNLNRDSAKFISKELVKLYPYTPIYFAQAKWEDAYYMANPRYYLAAIDKYVNQIKKYGVQNVAFRNLGKNIAADYNEKRLTTRQEALGLQQDKLKELQDNDSKVMINAGNAYAVPYSDFIVDMALDGKGFNIIDEEIPFYQIALHGLVPYAGKAINLADDYEKNILKTMETGAGLYFVFMNEETATLQDTAYTEYYGTDLAKWINTSSELYKKMEQDLSHIYNQFIVEHEILKKNVTKTVYEDGTKVIVNYNRESFSYEGKTVPGRDYIVLKGGN